MVASWVGIPGDRFRFAQEKILVSGVELPGFFRIDLPGGLRRFVFQWRRPPGHAGRELYRDRHRNIQCVDALANGHCRRAIGETELLVGWTSGALRGRIAAARCA